MFTPERRARVYTQRDAATGFPVRRLTLYPSTAMDSNGTSNESNILSRDEILAADDLKFEDVDVPEWAKNKKVRVRALSGTDRDAFETSLLVGTGKNQKISTLNIRAKLAALSIVDAENNPIFNLHDIETLGKKSSAALDRVFAVAQKLSKITDEDVEELAKNSDTVRSDGSSSDSP